MVSDPAAEVLLEDTLLAPGQGWAALWVDYRGRGGWGWVRGRPNAPLRRLTPSAVGIPQLWRPNSIRAFPKRSAAGPPTRRTRRRAATRLERFPKSRTRLRPIFLALAPAPPAPVA